MLSGGIPAFNGKTDAEIIAKVVIGKYSLETLYDLNVSDGAISLLTKLLEKDPEKRICPAEALKDPWIKANIKEDENTI